MHMCRAVRPANQQLTGKACTHCTSWHRTLAKCSVGDAQNWRHKRGKQEVLSMEIKYTGEGQQDVLSMEIKYTGGGEQEVLSMEIQVHR